jgi:hypothetical protein
MQGCVSKTYDLVVIGSGMAAQVASHRVRAAGWSVGATAERMLDAAARAYVNDRRGARIEDGRLIASKIYDWYQEDFGGSERGVIAHMRSYGGAPAGRGAGRCSDRPVRIRLVLE